MTRNRRNYTHPEAVTTLREWMRRQRMTQAGLQKWLDERGITISPQYLNALMHGQRTAGTKFREVFYAATGIRLESGLIETDAK